ncbi:outer membrane protein OmpA-like peptidoglycan-associated protein [Maritalea mobilis]|uniref:Outer membrane protein OmpA-like peptidoglycan-associated protein n=1 Tax=Maritalea mobilis TaxID=483324 RepID=A0A4R6VT52_9HYPH|nr:OmpA family protein [Maritalea mobilis]TDQ67272.1 outer membrane protein OmpA-like peptidoglycan-associated protein [Maritalea mobilis]
MKKELLLATVAAFSLSACTTTGWNSNAVKGGAGGAAAGAVAGLVYASVANKDARTAALVGAGLGALTGASVGAYMDRQEAELRNSLANTGVTVTRQGDQIILNMPSNVTFRTDQSNVEPQFYETLNSVAAVLQKYPKTLVDVYGHTDSTGSDQYNLELSNRRAMSVANYVSGRGVDPRRVYVTGYGESQPIASNATESGRAQNRRVEIQISPLT